MKINVDLFKKKEKKTLYGNFDLRNVVAVVK